MISSGNAEKESLPYRNWFIGDFREAESPFKTDKFEMKWSWRVKGYFAEPKEIGSIEENNTLGIFVEGKMRINFVDDNKLLLLENQGDYYFCKPTSRHSVEALEDTLIITLRW